VHAVRDEYAQHTTLDDRQPVTALTKNEGEPAPWLSLIFGESGIEGGQVDSPGLGRYTGD